jgi:hypothetical protein
VDKATGTLYYLPHEPMTAGKKAPFLRCHFILKMIGLPRQARGKPQKRVVSAATDVVVSLIPNVITLNGADHHSFKDMTITTSRDVAMLVSSSQHVTVDNCVVTNAGKTCLSLSGTNNTASGCDKRHFFGAIFP